MAVHHSTNAILLADQALRDQAWEDIRKTPHPCPRERTIESGVEATAG